jgi:hypothetical protein
MISYRGMTIALLLEYSFVQMEPLKRYRRIIIFFLILSLFFTLFLIKDCLHAKEDVDQCLSCHTDKNRMKALIPKFPEPPEEEGEA